MVRMWTFVTKGWRGCPGGTYYHTKKAALEDPLALTGSFELVSVNVSRKRRKI